ncbi:PREDICTED: transmembrane [Prunus dulcis]|uniref:PREDICTED: transmembrane n=1 Tax=Prunus dulcis TaxID=3755 RepID=A0A5E4EER6_PRUDU|nr:uncharacterized protein LOC117615388 [Prunus dulcis]KAI5352381.1 hypothetical protein L3X38_005272 [Prunus dulcis]VVA13459.1 PREDICTED: transmembrane [Prunus dulcis]
MEMESNLIMKNQKLEAFGILRKALIISTRNTNFFIFIILTSLPLFCFLVYYESSLQKSLVEISKILNPLHNNVHSYNAYFNLSWSIPLDIAKKLNKEFPYELTHLGLLYLVPLHLLKLSTVIVIVHLASKIYTEEIPTTMTFKEMVHRPFGKTRLKGTFVTYVYVLFLSTFTLLGLAWLGITYYALFRDFSFMDDRVSYAVLCWPSFVALLAMYLAWSSVWNVSVVISILEGTRGIKAFGQAIYLTSGCEWRGFILMLIFCAWEVGLRLPCLYIGSYERGNYIGLVAQVSLFCFGNVLKWVACMIYFYDCKNRALEKKLMMKSKKRVESCG